ncbi:hypothetical protein BHE74_00009277 [Ensete ventricosum]|nr:hypothetical protein BHE74_00009277 [Ensete ventricosum]
MVVRSSLEIMLDAIRQRDERPKDLPPALPVRPTSRGRLPTSKRSLPVNLKLDSSAARSLLTKSMNWEDKKEEQTLRSGINVVLKNDVFGSKIISDVEQLVESAYLMMPNLVSYEERIQVADGTDMPPLVATNNGVGCDGIVKYAMNQVIAGILWVQKNYRGVRARSRYQQLKKGATTLQSFIRGCLARKHFTVLKKVEASKVVHAKMSFTARRKSIVPEEMTKQSGWPDASQTNHCYEAEDDESIGAQTPEGTLAKLPNASDAMQVRNNDTARNAVIQLMKEFDQQRQVFDTDAGLLIEVKSGDINPYEELRNLKSHFASWKKDYKMRLKDTKTALLKLVNPEKRTYKRWWCTSITAR